MTENKYSRSKIYKVTDIGYNKCYIGSTIEPLAKRMSKHRSSYAKACRNTYCRSHDLFAEFGLENCKIELIEIYPCSSLIELLKRETEYIRGSN